MFNTSIFKYSCRAAVSNRQSRNVIYNNRTCLYDTSFSQGYTTQYKNIRPNPDKILYCHILINQSVVIWYRLTKIIIVNMCNNSKIDPTMEIIPYHNLSLPRYSDAIKLQLLPICVFFVNFDSPFTRKFTPPELTVWAVLIEYLFFVDYV